ncbi:MAG: Hsp70 family protein [Cytophagaceae bacterium]|nr:Hsp70 family protein [Cytophagaceae bacterium]
MSRFLYGIDFGTSNSALSIYDQEKQALLTTISIPSLLYFPDDQDPKKKTRYFTGQDAIEGYLQSGMKGRFMKSIKRVLPRSSFVETKIHTEMFNASDLVTLLLKELKKRADTVTGVDVKRVVMGRPVNFDDYNKAMDDLAQRRLLKAAQNAGFEEIRFQYEPIAAAFTYERVVQKPERVLVADFGGGTTDFTLVELNPERRHSKDRQKDIRATGGIYIGGDSFDAAFMWEKGTPYFGRGVEYESMPGKILTVPRVFFDNICSWESMNFYNSQKAQLDLKKYYSYSKENPKLKNLITLTEHNLGYSIFQSIEKTKIELSTQKNSIFEFSTLDIALSENISLEEYQAIISKDVAKIDRYLTTFLETHGIKQGEIDSLFLTGGSSLVRSIQDIFTTKFPGIPIKSEDNFISVAKGLAYSGYLFE